MNTTGNDSSYLSESAKPARIKKKNKTTKLLRVGILTLTILLVLLSFLALALPRFRVREVVVTGTSFYSQEEVESLSGIRAGDPVMEIDLDKTIQNILAKCRYMKSLSISVHLSGRVLLNVEEEACLMYTKWNDRYYSFSDSLKVLEVSDEPFPTFFEVTLPEAVDLRPGKKIVFQEEAAFAEPILVPLVKRLLEGQFAKKLTSVSIESEEKISFTLNKSYKVIFGKYRDLDEKEALLKAIIEQNGGIPEGGTIDLSDPKTYLVGNKTDE